MTDIAAKIAFNPEAVPHHLKHTSDGGRTAAPIALRGPTIFEGPDGAIVLTGAPRFGGEVSDTQSLARRILDAYLTAGPAVLDKLRGPFALVMLNRATMKCLAAIDRMGIERLVWGRQNGWISIGSSATEVAHDLAAAPALNQQALFNFMYSHMIPAPDTIFQNVRKLLPGSAIEFSASEQREYHYWQPDFSRDGAANINDLRNDTRPALQRAIELTNPGGKTGAFLSGGLDSSTITGLLAAVQDTRTKAFSVGFGVEEYDEMEFAVATAEHFACEHHIYEVTPSDVVELIPIIAAAYDEPFGNSSAVPTFCCARLAKEHGVEHLLAGDGGDEIFGGNERYVRHRVFELYNRVPAWLRNRVFGPLAERIDPEAAILPLRKFSSYVRQARIPLPERFESWNLIYREGADKIFSSEFLKSVDPNYIFDGMREVWNSCPSDDLVDRMLWFDWKNTLSDNDIRKVSRMCELAGVQVSYPMLDESFVELSMQIPSDVKIQGYELRTFFKNAVRGFLPDKILSKEKHGFGLPFGVWLKTHSPLQQLVYGSIESLGQRGMFDASFLDRVVTEHKQGHASYYGYAIWDLVMLEQWLQHHSY